LDDVGVAFEHSLDLARIDVLAAAHEHVVGAADEGVGASGVAAEDIRRFVPPVGGQDLLRFRGQINIPGHVGRRADP
jgi:hypothetical protein